MKRTDTAMLARAMRILSHDIRPHSAASSDAALDWYAQSSNWRREVRVAGPHRNWVKSPAAFDRGARAKFVLMCAGGRGARDDQMEAE